MTNLTADAIAALTPFADMGEVYSKQDEFDDSVWTETPDTAKLRVGLGDVGWNYITVGDLRRAREVRSALLSAQGQAGKPVASREQVELATRVICNGLPLPEAGESPLAMIARGICLAPHCDCWRDGLVLTEAALNAALALATIKGLEP